MSVVNNNLLLTADAGVAPSAYQVSRSLRFNSADSAYLNRTPSVAGNRKTWTWAAWVKRSALVDGFIFVSSFTSFPALLFGIISDKIYLTYTGGISGAGQNIGTAVLRDPCAWYHIVLAFDTTQSTASNRIKFYINGVQDTLSVSAPPTQNADYQVNGAVQHLTGGYSGYFFNGYLAECYLIDGQALTPSSFTETNATTGQLVPKAYTGTYGTNGFKLNFSDNSAATLYTLGADSRTDGALNGNNGTLVNGPTYSSANGGSIVFDGTNDYVINSSANDLPIGSSSRTVEMWVYPTTDTNPLVQIGGGGGQKYIVEFFNVSGTFYLFTDGINVGNNITFSGSNLPTLNAWNHFVFGNSGQNWFYYLNGTLKLSGTFPVTLNTVTQKYIVGTRDDTGPPYNTPPNGNIAKTSIYNRALSAAEILQNYNALVGRFGGTSTGSIVTDGMVLNLDAGNTASYPGTGTTWTDISLRKNNWTPNNLSVTAGAGNDSLTDSPTSYGTDSSGTGGVVRGNYATWNPLKSYGVSLANGNLDATIPASSSAPYQIYGSIGVSSGKWYYEIRCSNQYIILGIVKADANVTTRHSTDGLAYSYYGYNGFKLNTSGTSYGATYGAGDIIGVAFDLDAGTLTFYKNGSSQGVAFTGITGTYVAYAQYDESSVATSFTTNFGQRPFAYAAPSGFKALCDTNIPEGTITTSGTFTGNANADGPFVWLNGVPTAMTINSNAVTFATHADKLANSFKVRSSSGSYNTAGNNTYSITTTGAKFKYARAQPNP
jgi:hypothetical protein